MTKILLVEDDKSLREIYGVRLLAEGYDIVSAGDGEEALAMAIKDRPNLIISDVMMPKISGFDMLDILRSTTETKDIKVIMMTALSSEDQRARGESLGADRYLVKSQVGIEDVVRTVHEVLADAPVAAASFGQPQAAAGMRPAPTTTPAPRPVAPAAPTPAATPQPAPTAAPVAPAAPEPALPQPTAPFSTNRPASLGDRVIQPVPSAQPATSLAARMDEELSRVDAPATLTPLPSTPAPVATPAPAPAPAAPLFGAQPSVAPAAPSGLQFEATPTSPTPGQPQPPTA